MSDPQRNPTKASLAKELYGVGPLETWTIIDWNGSRAW